jgi:branched-chain amino acid transport system permease protein
MTLDTTEATTAAPAQRIRRTDWVVGGVVLAVMVLSPLVVSEYFLSAILTQALWLGIVAASLVFLAGYAGMVSLAQVAMFGIAAFAYGNVVLADGGLDTAWSPWVAIPFALALTVVVGLIFGLVASRSEGIYFLMISLAFSVIVYLFWGQVTDLSGFGGLNNVDSPSLVDNPTRQPNGLFYVTLGVAAVVFLLIRYIARTPFGLTLQGIRDDPTRMRALGFNVIVHRTLAFGFAAFIAGLAGILDVWWNTRIDPNSINLGQTINVLVIAVVGGLLRLEGAWIGALVFVVLQNYTRGTDLIGDRFNTLIGLIFLAVVLLSPGGLVGIWGLVKERVQRSRAGGAAPPAATPEAGG